MPSVAVGYHICVLIGAMERGGITENSQMSDGARNTITQVLNKVYQTYLIDTVKVVK